LTVTLEDARVASIVRPDGFLEASVTAAARPPEGQMHVEVTARPHLEGGGSCGV